MANKSKISFLVQTALLTAIIILMAITPLGYAIKVGSLSVTLLILPVAIGASASGAKSGAILGAAFGITSFIQCLGADFLGTLAFNISPVLCFIMCIVTRTIAGTAAGLVSSAMKRSQMQVLRYILTAVTASLLNSILFLSSLYFFFAEKMMESDSFRQVMSDSNAAGKTFFAFIIAPSIINVIAEAITNTAASSAIMAALSKSKLIKNNQE